MIAGERATSTYRDRMQGYLRELRRGGIPIRDVRVEPGYYTYEGGYRAALAMPAAGRTSRIRPMCSKLLGILSTKNGAEPRRKLPS